VADDAMLRDEKPTLAQLEQKVRLKLEQSLLPRVEQAKRLKSGFNWNVYQAHTMTNEFALVAGAIGLSHPVAMVFADGTAASGEGGLGGAVAAIADYPPALAAVSLFAVGTAITLRIVVGWKKLGEKGPLIEACVRELMDVEDKLDPALQSSDPLPKLNDLVETAGEIAARYRAGGVDMKALGREEPVIVKAATERADELVKRYSGQWTVAP
jgi:hypothetical protein